MTYITIPDRRAKHASLILGKPKITKSDSGKWWVEYGNKGFGHWRICDSWREAMDWAIKADQHMHCSIDIAFRKL